MKELTETPYRSLLQIGEHYFGLIADDLNDMRTNHISSDFRKTGQYKEICLAIALFKEKQKGK